MAAPYDFDFERKPVDISTMIRGLYADVEGKKQQLEQTIKLMKQLFKPWPPPGENMEVETTETKSENIPGVEVNTAAATEITEVISPEEQAGLDMVDQLLNKAQKARNVQKQLEEPKRSRGTINHRHTKSEQTPDHTSSIDSGASSSPGTTGVVQKPETMKHISKYSHNNIDSKAHVRKQTDTVKTDKPVSTSRELSGKPKQTQNTKNIHAQGRPIVERPKGGLGKKTVVPAHVSAPYQTNPHLPSKVQTTYRAATAPKPRVTHGTGSAGSGHYSALPNKGNKSAPRTQAVSAKQQSSHQRQPGNASEKHTNKNLNNSSEVCDVDETQDCDNGDIAEHRGHTMLEPGGQATNNCDINMDAGKGEHVLSKKMNNLRLRDQTKVQQPPGASGTLDKTHGCTETEGHPAGRQSEKDRFLLVRDGPSITIPVKLRKFVSQNTKLQQKLFTQSVTKKVNTPVPSQEFPGQLQHMFGEAEDASVQLLGRQLQCILSTESHLQTLLLSLHLETITEECPIEEIVRARRLLEYILTTFQEMEDLVHSLDCRPLQTTAIYDSSHHSGSQPPDLTSLSTWYNTRYIPANAASTITYRSYKELEKYRSLVFKLQHTQAQLDIMESTYKTVLPIIGSLDPETSEFVQALQCGYAMLSTNPNQVPVIVTDNLDEGSDQ